MRMTLNVDDELVAKASELTGVQERTALVRMGLEALIAQKSAQRLARLGGTEKQLRRPPREDAELADGPGRYLGLGRASTSCRSPCALDRSLEVTASNRNVAYSTP